MAELEEAKFPLEGQGTEKPVAKKAVAAKKRPKKPEKAAKKAAAAGQGQKQASKARGKMAGNAFARLLEEKPMHASAVACVAIIAVALFFALSPKEASIEDLWENNGSQQQSSEVKMIVLASNRCPDCEDFSSLEMLFIANGVRYGVQEIEESTEDGQRLIQATGVESLPAYIIDEKSISDNAVVKTVSGFQPLKDVLHFYVNQGKGTFKEGIFAFPEMNLDNGPVKPMLLLGEACGSKQSFNIQLFLDPYDPNTIGRSKDMENMRSGLEMTGDINVAFGYNYLPTYSAKMEKDYLALYGGKPATVRQNIEGAARYLVCANDFGDDAFIKMQRSIYATYCDINWSTINLENPEPLWKCGDSNHFGVWVNGEELLLAARRAGVEGNLLFNNCLYNVEQKMQNSLLLAEAAGIDRTPAALVNCQYVVPISSERDYIRATVCMINSKVKYC